MNNSVSEGNKVIKSGVWFTVSNFIMKSIGFITTPIFTRLLTKAEFGDFNNFQTWMMILLYITSLNLEGSLIRAVKEFRDDIDTYLLSMISLSMGSTIVWAIVCNVAYPIVGDMLSVNRVYLNCMFMYLFFAPTVNLFQNIERFKYKYKWTVATSMTVSIGASLLSVVLVISMPDKLFGRVIGYIAPTVIIGAVIFVYYLKKVKAINIQYWKYALPITLPYIPHLLSMYLLGNMDRVMIKRFCGSEDLALYSLAYTCGMIITMLLSSINSAYSPWLSDKLSEEDYNATRKISVIYIGVFSFVSIGIVLITPEILLILGGESYLEAKHVMPPVAAGCLLQFVYTIYVNVEQYEKKTIGMAVASAAAAFVNYVLNYIFIPAYGYIAAAYTTYIGYFVLLIIHMGYVKKIGKWNVYNNTLVFAIAVSASVLMFLNHFLLEVNIVRYILIVIYMLIVVAFVLRNKQQIRTLVKK